MTANGRIVQRVIKSLDLPVDQIAEAAGLAGNRPIDRLTLHFDGYLPTVAVDYPSYSYNLRPANLVRSSASNPDRYTGEIVRVSGVTRVYVAEFVGNRVIWRV